MNAFNISQKLGTVRTRVQSASNHLYELKCALEGSAAEALNNVNRALQAIEQVDSTLRSKEDYQHVTVLFTALERLIAINRTVLDTCRLGDYANLLRRRTQQASEALTAVSRGNPVLPNERISGGESTNY